MGLVCAWWRMNFQVNLIILYVCNDVYRVALVICMGLEFICN